MERGKERKIGGRGGGGREEALTMTYMHSLVHESSHPLYNIFSVLIPILRQLVNVDNSE